MELRLSTGNPQSIASFMAAHKTPTNVGLHLSFGRQIDEDEEEQSSEELCSAGPSLQLNLSVLQHNKNSGARDFDVNQPAEEEDQAGGMAEEDDGGARKKLRLSKQQSASLEECFKEHNTLNPKQKIALAKQLNLRPRQVEVWFQNRRARTKLKQTEVDCEYLKRCCEKLTDENRRLQKELSELRALKTARPFYMHLPATTLSMCPSCERVASTTTNNSLSGTSNIAAAANAGEPRPNSFAALFSKPRLHPFALQQQHQSSAAS